MRDSRFALGIVAITLAVLWFAPLAQAEEALSVTPMPSEIELSVGGSARGVLVLANTSEDTLRHARVRYAGAGGSVRFRLLNRKREIPGKGTVVLSFRVARVSEGSGKDVNIRIVASYLMLRARRVTVSTLTVKPLPAAPLVEANIESKVETINENRSGEGALILKNPRESLLRIDEVQVRAPDDVKIALSCKKGKPSLETAEATMKAFSRKQIRDCRGAAQVRTRSQEVWPVTFSTPDSIAPGHRLVLVRVRGSDPRASRRASSQTVVASTTFDVEVFGESAILKAVGVPVFLLLPGVIVVAVTWFLLTQVYPRRHKDGGHGGAPKLLADIDTTVEKVSVAAIAGVGVSLLIALVYPWLTAWQPGQERNYLRAYGFRDFYIVFGYSFVIAAAFWILVVVLFLGRLGFRWLFVLSEGDEPADLLRKIGLSSLSGSALRSLGWDTAMGSTKLPRVAFGEGQGRRALRLKRRKERVLVAPTIRVELISRASETTLAREIEACIADDRPVALWWKLRNAKWKRGAVLGFQSSGSIERPEWKAGDDLRPTGQFGPVVALAVQH